MASESRIKTEHIPVRASPAEKIELKARADAFGISMGELCRKTLFGVVVKSKTDLNEIQELAATRADLGRLGGLLKGWLAGSFPNGVSQPSTHEVVALLNQIQDAQKLVVASVKKVVNKS